jgi:hypothetical protein
LLQELVQAANEKMAAKLAKDSKMGNVSYLLPPEERMKIIIVGMIIIIMICHTYYYYYYYYLDGQCVVPAAAGGAHENHYCRYSAIDKCEEKPSCQ